MSSWVLHRPATTLAATGATAVAAAMLAPTAPSTSFVRSLGGGGGAAVALGAGHGSREISGRLGSRGELQARPVWQAGMGDQRNRDASGLRRDQEWQQAIVAAQR